MDGPRIRIPHEAVADFCRRHRIMRLSLFGSVTREDFGTDSDVDVLVEFDPDSHIGLGFFGLAEELGGILGRRVDLITPGFLGPEARVKIASKAYVEYDAA
jgi:hypothetical protein